MAAPQPGRPGLRAHPALGALRLALLLLLAVPLAAGDPCPCQDAALCRPIQQRRDSEVSGSGPQAPKKLVNRALQRGGGVEFRVVPLAAQHASESEDKMLRQIKRLY